MGLAIGLLFLGLFGVKLVTEENLTRECEPVCIQQGLVVHAVNVGLQTCQCRVPRVSFTLDGEKVNE